MVKFDPKIHHRHSIRLKGYDYAQAGAYFVTMVTRQREFLFGEIVNKEMELNPNGEIVQKWWGEISNHFANVETGAFVVMPNHIHGIIFILERRGNGVVPRSGIPVPDEKKSLNIPEQIHKTTTQGFNKSLKQGGETSGGETPPLQMPTLGQIVAYFKYQSTKEMNALGNTGTVTKFWQRNYYEHVIRDEKDLQNKTDYIEANPLLWDEDDENPINIK
jgi:putative transposase